MAEKVEKLGVTRDKDFMYYVKESSVWRVQRKQPGVPKGKSEKVADGTFQMDTNFIYFVDKDGDVSRAKRAVGGQKRKKSGSEAKARSAPRKAAPTKSKPKGKAGGGKVTGGKSASAKASGKSSKASKKPKAGAKKPAKASKTKSSASKKGAAKKKRR